MPLTLYNTLTKRAEPFVPADSSHVTFYTCGPTVYDDAHIGNFRSFLAADVLRRFVESGFCEVSTGTGAVHRGPRVVTHVMNITDVGHMTDDSEGGEHGEDRMAVAGRRLAEAKKSGKLPAGVEVDPNNPYQIARFYEERFKEDARRLGLKLAIQAETDPTLMPRATEHIPGMIEAVSRLVARGCAYVVGEPGRRVVYFDVTSFPAYGRLSGNTLDSLREGEGGRVNAENQASKRHPADFLLWKEEPSHIMKWESPWGWGYPGWHIECTAMSVSRLAARPGPQGWIPTDDVRAPGAIIDLHSGGEDNIFPHHECEIAQSCCAYTSSSLSGTFARMWFHPRFLLVEGTKMSKSKGNFFTARDLFAKGHEPAAVRLELIRTHYRSNANFTMQGLADSQKMVERWRRFQASASGTNPGGQGLRDGASLAFADAMHADLNVAAAIAEVNKFVASVERPGREDADLVSRFDAVLGVLEREAPKAESTSIGIFTGGLSPDPAVIELLEKRRAARASKDFAASDRIRDELLAMGLLIKDVAGGKVEVSRKV